MLGRLQSAAETPMFDNVKQKQMYREKILGNPPEVGTPEHEHLMEFASKVDVILHTVNDNEYQAAVTCMEPPAIRNFPNPAMVVGMFAGKRAALIQTPQGSECRKSIDTALKLFPNAKYIIAVGVCYAFDHEKYKLGDVLVSKKISNLANFKLKKDGTVEDRGETIDVEGFLSDTFCLNAIHNPQFKVTDSRESDVYSGQFLSHPVLMDNKTERDKFHAAVSNAIGGEMEGGVLMKVSKEKEGIDVIVIKGVVDYGDGDKEKQWQFTAALAALHYTQSKLSAVNIPPRGNPDQPPVQEGSEETDDVADMEEEPTAIAMGSGRLSDEALVIKIKDIIRRHAAEWWTIGQGLGFTYAELDTIQGMPMLLNKAPGSWLDKMLADWHQWRPGDDRKSKGYATLEAIATAVNKAGLGVVAEKICNI